MVPVARGIAEIFREAKVLRENRERARLKFLFLQHGWTADSFLSELQQRIGFTLDPAEPEEVPSDVHRDHVGIHAQKQLGFSYVGANVLERPHHAGATSPGRRSFRSLRRRPRA